MSDGTEYAKLVKRRHPDYTTLKAHWDFLEATYRGGREWFAGNIHRYFKEGDSEFDERVKRAYRFNHSREVVDLVNKYLTRKAPERRIDDAPLCVQQFWENTDRSGMNMNEFMRTVSLKSSIFGCPWVIVDSEPTPEVVSLAEAEEIEGGCYAYIVPPQQVMDFAYGEDGQLLWILVEEIVRNDIDPFESDGSIYPRYRLWTRTDWMLFSPVRNLVSNTLLTHVNAPSLSINQRVEASALKYELIDSGTHGLGRVPAIRADNIVSDEPYSVPALINDVAYLDKAIANYLSNLDAIIQDQTFSQLAIPAQNLMPGDDQYDQVLNMGTKRVFVYDGENGQKPFFLSPDPRQAELILSAIQQMINEIYHSVGLAGERTKQDNAKGIDNSSGVAKAKDFERVNSLLLSKADALERVENKIVELVCLWNGEKLPERELVVYPESFDVQGLFDEFDIAQQLMTLSAPILYRVEQMKRVGQKVFIGRSEDFVKKLDEAAEEWGEAQEEQRELQQENVAAQGEALRNRAMSGARQSDTKTRQENRRKESDQETGQSE